MWVFISVLMIIIATVIISIFKNKNKDIKKEEIEIGKLANIIENNFPTIQIVENKMIIPEERNKIIDKDINKAIGIIDNTIPNSAIIGKNVKNAKELLNNTKAFFSTSKNGTENMMKVKGTNEVYGTQVIGNKFSKQTKFVGENEIIEKAGRDALVNAGFCTASMIVGQYYMNEINNKLEELKDEINIISDLLDSEYQGKLFHIISKMKEIIDNKVEILDNDFSRNKRYDEIIELENDCTKLLGQANEMIKNNIKKVDIDYRKYEKTLKEIYKWFLRQQILQTLLLEIGNLRYVLAYGNETSKLSHTQYNNYLEQNNIVNESLEKWHNLISEKLGIDIKEARRNGSFFKIRKNTIGKINEEWSYNKIDDKIIKIIERQTNIKKLKPYIYEKQDKIIKIQKYNGEYYNLLEENNNKI